MKSYHANLGAGIDGLVVRELMILRGWYETSKPFGKVVIAHP
jgi:hypothetical protein